jgi:curli biogenesis system outer membrane secretion channel CsgG
MAVRHGIPGRLARHLTVLTLGATVLAGSAMTTVRAEETRVSANVLKTPVRSIPGPKRTVAVSRFASKSDFNLHYGLTDVGGGLSAMLTAALVESGQFLVVERETLSDVLAEQSLIASGLVKEEGAAIPGALLGASLLVKGAVTEFSEAAGGGGFGIGLAGVGVGIKSRVAMVGLDIQIIDATTSQVLASYKVLEKASGKAVGVDLARAGIDTGFTKFFETPIGQAARKAITAAVERLARWSSTRGRPPASRWATRSRSSARLPRSPTLRPAACSAAARPVLAGSSSLPLRMRWRLPPIKRSPTRCRCGAIWSSSSSNGYHKFR